MADIAKQLQAVQLNNRYKSGKGVTINNIDRCILRNTPKQKPGRVATPLVRPCVPQEIPLWGIFCHGGKAAATFIRLV